MELPPKIRTTHNSVEKTIQRSVLLTATYFHLPSCFNKEQNPSSYFHLPSFIFDMLTSTFCKNEDFDGAIQIMQEMIERCMALDTFVLSKLYSGLCRCGNDQLAMKLLNEMEIRCLLPEGFDKVELSTLNHRILTKRMEISL